MKSLIKRMIVQSGVEPSYSTFIGNYYTEADLYKIVELVARERAKQQIDENDRLQAAYDSAFKQAMQNGEELAKCKEDAESKQAQIDALMFEYCPDEMTQEQIAEYEKHQIRGGEG